jgi:hypothetical protein
MRISALFASTVLLLQILLPVRTSLAYDLPGGLNLGFTTFLDGGPPAGPGFYFTQYFQYFRSNELMDSDGHELRLPTLTSVAPGEHHKVNTRVSLTQFIYQSTVEGPLGSKLGLDVIIPWVGLDLSPSDSLALQDNGSGIGDILIGPYFQWDPVMGEKGPRFMQRVELQMIFPTGRYSNSKELNPGANHFYFNPYWSGTFFHTPRCTSSIRFHYLWNAKNNDPADGVKAVYQPAGFRVRDMQAGQAVHANVATAYEVIAKRLRVGLNGYFLKQLTDTKIDTDSVRGRKEQVFALGPGLVYHFSQQSHLFINTYFEFKAKNRPEGQRLNLRFVQHF